MNMIQMTKVEAEHALKCPACQHPRLAVQTDSISVPGGGHWLSDGDTIFGLHRDLVTAGIEKAVPSGVPEAWYSVNYSYYLLVGDCSSCKEEYFVLEVSMIEDSVTVDEQFVESYFRGNAAIPEPTNFVATLQDKQLEWLVRRHDTPKGVALCHTFGPFALTGKTMRGDNGVSSCSSGDMDTWKFGREFLFCLWPDLKALARQENQGARHG